MRRLHEFDEPKAFAFQYFPLAPRDQTIGLFAGAFKRTRQRRVRRGRRCGRRDQFLYLVAAEIAGERGQLVCTFGGAGTTTDQAGNEGFAVGRLFFRRRRRREDRSYLDRFEAGRDFRMPTAYKPCTPRLLQLCNTTFACALLSVTQAKVQ